MSRRQFKAQASSSRAAFVSSSAFGSSPSFTKSTSPLSYLNELPHLSVSDAHIVVAFKNLSKKDSTTKGKALEDLLSLLSASNTDIEEGVLEAWTNIYPRTAIDESRRVRQLAHTAQGQIATLAGKRIAKYLPKAIGAWLAGLYDNDKLVAKAASDALQQVFSTPEKRQALWKVYQQAVLEYCRTVFEDESAQTLSDERSVGPDEANAKYYRLVTAAIGLLSNLISNVKMEDYPKCKNEYSDILQNKKLWQNVLSEDAAVRRSFHKMCRALMQSENAKGALDVELMSTSYLSRGLDSEQGGSASEFVETVISLTGFSPTIWTDQWQAKKSPDSRLRQFVKRGSQGAPINYWASVARLFQIIPTGALPTDITKAHEILKAYHSGVTKRDEPRAYVAAGMQSYVSVANTLCSRLPQDDKTILMKETVLPLVLEYIMPTAKDSNWNIPGARSANVVLEAVRVEAVSTGLEQQWPFLAEHLIQDIKATKSGEEGERTQTQAQVTQKGHRYATVLSILLKSSYTNKSVFESGTEKILQEALLVCKRENGEKEAAAATVAAIVRECKGLWPENSAVVRTVEDFVRTDLAPLYQSPSFKDFAVILFSFNDQPFFQAAWMATLLEVLKKPSKVQLPALKELLVYRHAISDADLDILRSRLRPFIIKETESLIKGSHSWDPIADILARSAAASDVAADEVLSKLMESLTLSPGVEPAALSGLEAIAKKAPSLIQTFLATVEGKPLLPNILLLTESPDDNIAQSASDLYAVLHSILGESPTSGNAEHGMLEVLKDGLAGAGEHSVSVETLVKQAQNLLDMKKVSSVAHLLPPAQTWSVALEPFFQRTLAPELAITHQLAGATFLVQPSPVSDSARLERDVEGFSIPLRMALYTTRLLRAAEKEQGDIHSDVYRLLALTLQLANDNLSRARSTNLWSIYNAETETEMVEFVSDCQGLLTAWLHDFGAPFLETGTSDNNFIGEAADALFNASNGLSREAYYNAQAYCTTVGELVEIHGWHSRRTADLELRLKTLRNANDNFQLVAFLTAYQTPLSSSTVASRYCNELIADLDAFDLAENPFEVLRQLVLLNSILQNQETAVETIAKQRLVRFVRKVVSWLDEPSIKDQLRGELYRVLCVLLPSMSDMYGDHWSAVSVTLELFWENVQSLWQDSRPALIPALHASLKLYNILRRMTSEEEMKPEDERNDDLIEAWNELEQDAGDGLFNLVILPREFPDELHQPLRTVNELLARQVIKVPIRYLKKTEELYSQLYSESRSIQEVAFDILHKDIPRKQEQISFDAALEKKAARLPDELLSLVLEAPTMASLNNASFERAMPLHLRGYLFSWLLVFDHFQNSSFKVKADYVDNIKDDGHLTGFLDFAFDFLGHTKGKPADVSKFDLTTYSPDNLDSPLKDTQWLLTHLYYLSLTHLPSLSKTWWIECKTRQKVISVESWTAKFISPHVIANALSTVNEWADTQEQPTSKEEPPALVIKTNPRAAEVQVSYPLDDEQSATITISLPPTFPLHQARVTSNARSKAVEEKRWNSWLRNAQGVIAFNNSSIVDGLVAWRRNVFGAFKGQTECSICYSIVGEDGRLPTKTCRTCKNAFHGVCLYKWFKSSNQTTCPLCRQPFNYGAAPARGGME